MRIRIVGTDLPGRSCGPSPDRPDGHHNIHVGVQRRNNPRQWLDLQPGDAGTVTWTFDATATQLPQEVDVLGPYIQGGPGQRFIYLSWGTLTAGGEFTMFRRAKLFVADIDETTLRAAIASGHLVARLGLTDAKGNPTCARVRPSAIRWAAEQFTLRGPRSSGR